MTAKLFKSTDASAPVLTGAVGSLVALLDAVLVNGYGAIAAAGWTKPYTATNKAVFRNDSSTGTGFYLDVDDSAPATAKEARVRGYETMSAVATGTEPFPTAVQLTNGIFVRKSNTADATARPWFILADETVFYLFVESGDYTVPTRTTAFSFGDFFSYKTSDNYRCMIIGRTTENSATPNSENFPKLNSLSSGRITNLSLTGHYIARSSNGVGGSITFGLHGDLGASGISSVDTGMGVTLSSVDTIAAYGLGYPNNADSGLYMAPVYIHHLSGIRGYLKGLWTPSHDAPLGHQDTFSGTGWLSAKSFICMQMLTTPSFTAIPCQCFLETTNTWS